MSKGLVTAAFGNSLNGHVASLHGESTNKGTTYLAKVLTFIFLIVLLVCLIKIFFSTRTTVYIEKLLYF